MSEWIDVQDESIPLPEHLQVVLVWLSFTDYEGEQQAGCDFAIFHAPSSSNQWFQSSSFGEDHDPLITHWMPLPEPPK